MMFADTIEIMTIEESARRSAAWGVLLTAAAILMITMGTRQTTGLFLSPLNTATGLGIATISFAMAVGQFVWGAAQPISGALADRYGPVPVLIGSGVMLALGTALTPQMSSEWGLIVSLGILTAAGSGAGSFSILIGASSRQLPENRRSFAAGFINAGGSFGQFFFAPVTERIIALAGWVNAMYMLALASLLTIPLAIRLGRMGRRQRLAEDAAVTRQSMTDAAAHDPRDLAAKTPLPSPAAALPVPDGLGKQLRAAFADRSYLLLHAGFFTCGFHIAFLVTHLPGEVALCGLPAAVSGISIALIGLANIAGSLAAGKLGERYRMKHLLFWMYLSRAVMVLLYMAAPKTPATFYILAVALGLTWLATVPPTAGLVGKLFGVRYLATLFGITLLSHQIGGFLGAWLGGVAFERTGSFDAMWIADAVLAALAAVVNLPIRENPVAPKAAAVAGPPAEQPSSTTFAGSVRFFWDPCPSRELPNPRPDVHGSDDPGSGDPIYSLPASELPMTTKENDSRRITLHTWNTPNGRKISVALEEMGLAYDVQTVDITQGQQHEPAFLKISPNNRIPAIVDPDGPGAKPISVFESGAILLYLGEKTGLFLPKEPAARIAVYEWLMWQMGGFGPMPGQVHHFAGLKNEADQRYGLERYQKETERLYGVMDRRLADRAYFADEISIADFAIVGWAWRHERHRVDLGHYPNVRRWYDAMMARPATKRGFEVALS